MDLNIFKNSDYFSSFERRNGGIWLLDCTYMCALLFQNLEMPTQIHASILTVVIS